MMKKITILVMVLIMIVFSINSIMSQRNFPDDIISKLKPELSSLERESLLSSLVRSDKISNELVEQLRGQEKVRAIVVLSDDIFTKNLEKKMLRVRKNQKQILSELNRFDFNIVHQYKTLNMLALEINPRALSMLEKSGVVESVNEDRNYHTTLGDSVPLIEADLVHNGGDEPGNYTGEGVSVCVIDTGVDYTHFAIGSSSCSLNYENESLSEPLTWNLGDEDIIITKPGFSQMGVHFSEINLLAWEYEGIEVYDGDGNLRQIIYSEDDYDENYCNQQFDKWSITVPGDTIRLHFNNYTSNEPGEYCSSFYSINKVANISWQNCNDFLGGYDFVNNDADPMDDKSHGTHVSGIVTSDDEDVRGVAPDAGILGIKVLDEKGDGSETDIIAGVDFCIANKDYYNISVLSMSLGETGFISSTTCDNRGLSIAVNNANQSGLFVAVASGNDADYTGIGSPACASGAVSVGATYDAYVDNIAYDSCSEKYQPADNITCFTNRNILLDLLAPGAIIFSAYTGEEQADFFLLSGTSQAAPHVSGLAALMLEANPDLTPDEIRNIMKNTGKMIYDNETELTFKRINASKAVQEAIPDSLSITVSSNSLAFNEVDPDNTGFPDENPLNIEIVSSVDYEVSVEPESDTFTGPGTLNDEQLEWATSLNGQYTEYDYNNPAVPFSGTSPGSPTGGHDLYHKLTIPSGTNPGDYNLNINFKVTSI